MSLGKYQFLLASLILMLSFSLMPGCRGTASTETTARPPRSDVIFDETIELSSVIGEAWPVACHVKATERDGALKISQSYRIPVGLTGNKPRRIDVSVEYDSSLMPAMIEYTYFIGETMTGQAELTSGEESWTLHAVAFTTKQGTPLETPKESNIEMRPPKGRLFFPMHIPVIGPRLLKEPGTLENLTNVEFDDSFPDCISWKGSKCRLVREDSEEGGFTINFSGPGESDYVFRFDSSGKFINTSGAFRGTGRDEQPPRAQQEPAELFVCPRCKGNVPADCTTCPHCGQKFRPVQPPPHEKSERK